MLAELEYILFLGLVICMVLLAVHTIREYYKGRSKD